MKIRIIPKTKHLKDLVGQLGSVWILREPMFKQQLMEKGLITDDDKILESLVPVHNNKTHPLAMWVVLGKDLEIEQIS